MEKTATIGVIDYGGGNLQNVLNALGTIGVRGRLIDGPADLAGIDQLIFPGVGAFGDCARHLDRRDLREPIRDWLAAGKPYLGICLGYQILFEGSEESPRSRGLEHFAGTVTCFPEGDLKVPHMGWNVVEARDPGAAIWEGLPEHPHFYFVHSYFPRPESDALVAATTDYGLSFAAAVQEGPLFACQFHPERSQSAGLRLLRNFLVSTRAEAETGPGRTKQS